MVQSSHCTNLKQCLLMLSLLSLSCSLNLSLSLLLSSSSPSLLLLLSSSSSSSSPTTAISSLFSVSLQKKEHFNMIARRQQGILLKNPKTKQKKPTQQQQFGNRFCTILRYALCKREQIYEHINVLQKTLNRINHCSFTITA